MKKYAMYVPLGLMLLLPVCGLLAMVTGYQWTWEALWVFAAVAAVLIWGAVFSVPKHTMPAPPAGLCLLLAVVNQFIILLLAARFDDLAAVLLSLSWAAAGVVLLKRAKPYKRWKTVFSVAAILLFGVYICTLPVMAFGAMIGYMEVVDTVCSPNGRYRAELLDINDGALGGDTVVKIYDERGALDFGFCRLQKDTIIAYTGPWGEFENIDLEWESDTVLLIDGRPYNIEEETP